MKSRSKKSPPEPEPVRPAVPVLTASDLIWNFSTASGRKDLLEWLDTTFSDKYGRHKRRHRRAERRLCSVISQRFGRQVSILWVFLEYCKRNRFPSLAWQAACWNEAMRRLKYEIPAEACTDTGLRG